MKNDKGISLITLVMTIIIMIILVGISIHYGLTKNVTKTYESDRYTEVLNISDAVKQRELVNRIDSDRYPYVGVKLSSANSKEINGIEYSEGWYYISAEESARLNLEGVKGNYVVNYPTGEVVSTESVLYEGKEYYSSTELKNVIIGKAQNMIPDSMFDQDKKVNKPILVDGMIPVKNVDGKWIITNESDPTWYDYSAENNVWANVMLLDELAVEGMTNEQIRALPNKVMELQNKEVTVNGSMLVWIPRFSYKDTSVVYSRLLIDYTDDGYTLNNMFVDTTKTGAWISKYDASIIR